MRINVNYTTMALDGWRISTQLKKCGIERNGENNIMKTDVSVHLIWNFQTRDSF